MIVVGNQKQDGHTIHLIVGPETELFMDLHGSAEIDITELVKALPDTPRLTLQLTRCKCEDATAKSMGTGDIPYSFSFAARKPHPAPQSDVPDVEALLSRKRGSRASVDARGCCSYCGDITDTMMDIPGVEICRDCARSLLGNVKHEE